jgi:hypothetical protein
MGKSNTNEERQLSKLIDKFPLNEEIKAAWKGQIMGGGGLTEELADEIQKKLSGEGDEESGPIENFVQLNTQFSVIIRRWRLARQTQSFKKRAR